jgi:ribosomal protein L15E
MRRVRRPHHRCELRRSTSIRRASQPTHTELVTKAAFDAERRATVERIRDQLRTATQAEIDFFHSHDVFTILDEEAER